MFLLCACKTITVIISLLKSTRKLNFAHAVAAEACQSRRCRSSVRHPAGTGPPSSCEYQCPRTFSNRPSLSWPRRETPVLAMANCWPFAEMKINIVINLCCNDKFMLKRVSNYAIGISLYNTIVIFNVLCRHVNGRRYK